MAIKWIVAFGVVSLGGAGFAFAYLGNEQRDSRACENVARRCSSLVPITVDECVRTLRAAREQGMPRVADQVRACVDGADSCPEIVGCGIGAVLGRTLGEFGQGIERGAGSDGD